MSNNKNRAKYKIAGQVEYMEGNTKVIATEYTDGSKSHRKIRPKRPLYRQVWFYILIIIFLFILSAIQQYKI